MATLTKGTTIATDTTVTAQTLHTLIEQALVSGITASDLNVGFYFLAAQATAPNPSNFPVWYSTDPLDPVLRIYATPFNIWLTVGPDRFEIPLYNPGTAGTSGIIPRGAQVCSTGASTMFMASQPSLNAIGFCQDTTVSGSWGPVCTFGIGYALYTSGVSLNLNAVSQGNLLANFGVPLGGVNSNSAAASGQSTTNFGMWLDNPAAANTLNPSAWRALIWGPKLIS